jgi:hypothetical protein
LGLVYPRVSINFKLETVSLQLTGNSLKESDDIQVVEDN